MPKFHPKAPYLVLIFGLGCIVVSHLLVPINPEYSLPGIPEFFSVAVLSGLLYYALYGAKSLRRSHWVIRPREKFLLGYIWAIVLLITGPRALWSLFFTPGQVWNPCLAVPGLAFKLECFLQASYSNTYGLRTYFTLVMATLLGTLAFFFARMVRKGGRLLLGAIAFGPVLVAIVSFTCIALGIEQALPKVLMYNSFEGFAFGRFVQVFGNPSWVWPYCAPGLAIALWYVFAAQQYGKRLIAMNGGILLISGIVWSQQSGGLVLCGLYFLACNGYALYLNSRRIFWGLSGLLVAALVWILRNDALIQSILAQNNPFIEQQRLKIWGSALKMFRDSPVIGHGYASWFQTLKSYDTGVGLFDTAHNFYVQILAELGLFHTLLIWIALVLIAIAALPARNDQRQPLLLISLGVVAFIVPTAVQEIDYLRPIFYMHTLFWGTLIGTRFNDESASKQETGSNQKGGLITSWRYQLNTRLQTIELFRRDLFNMPITVILSRITRSLLTLLHKIGIHPRYKHGLISLTSVASLGLIFCLLNFNLGASVFEADVTQAGFIARWFGPQVRLASFGSLANKSYSIYSAGPQIYPMNAQMSDGLTVVVDSAADELWLSPENGNVLWPKHHTYTFDPVFGSGSRWVSVLTPPPFVQSNLGMAWSGGMGPWEEFEGVTGRWCGADCWFVAKSCGVRDRLDLTLAAPRPDLESDRAIAAELTTYSLPIDGQFSRQSLGNITKPLSQETLQITPQDPLPIEVDGATDTGWYLVHAETFSTFTEPPADENTPGRELGMAILESDCQGIQ
ncbi:O-antigen ligase family protein [Spirulina major]|uniref:O-antigen ligase family protein n=1 Tax=Spirulina major TaxID=270636 RepID=UPI000934F8E2|nr:O-antigen ligase family protein [Spirulina major]